ncbi:hypothetical protein HOE91_04475 [archaeon]|jgi:hypothetical protein|nr:hypothetical protein [archaeon]
MVLEILIGVGAFIILFVIAKLVLDRINKSSKKTINKTVNIIRWILITFFILVISAVIVMFVAELLGKTL